MREGIQVSLSLVLLRITDHNCCRCLLPDGCIQQVQIDWTPQGASSNSAIRAWSEELLRGSELLRRSARVQPSKTRRLLEAAGFTNIVQRVVSCHLVPQKEQSDFDSQDTEEYKLLYLAPNWLNVIFQRSLAALSWEPLSEGLGMSDSAIRQLCQDAKKRKPEKRLRCAYKCVRRHDNSMTNSTLY